MIRVAIIAVAVATGISALTLPTASAEQEPVTHRATRSWTFYADGNGCNTKIRKITVTQAGSPTVRDVIVNGQRKHSLTVLDARPKRILYSDYNCRTERDAVRVALLGETVKKVTVTASSKHVFDAAFIGKGTKVAVGHTDYRIDGPAIRTYRVQGSRLLRDRVYPNVGSVWDMDWAGATYLDVQKIGFGTPYRVVAANADGSVGQSRLTAPDAGLVTAKMSISRGNSLALTANPDMGAVVRIDSGRTGPDAKQVRACGGAEILDVTWLDSKVLLAACDYTTGFSYQLIDLRGGKVKRTWLGTIGTPGAAGGPPVGLG